MTDRPGGGTTSRRGSTAATGDNVAVISTPRRLGARALAAAAAIAGEISNANTNSTTSLELKPSDLPTIRRSTWSTASRSHSPPPIAVGSPRRTSISTSVASHTPRRGSGTSRSLSLHSPTPQMGGTSLGAITAISRAAAADEAEYAATHDLADAGRTPRRSTWGARDAVLFLSPQSRRRADTLPTPSALPKKSSLRRPGQHDRDSSEASRLRFSDDGSSSTSTSQEQPYEDRDYFWKHTFYELSAGREPLAQQQLEAIAEHPGSQQASQSTSLLDLTSLDVSLPGGSSEFQKVLAALKTGHDAPEVKPICSVKPQVQGRPPPRDRHSAMINSGDTRLRLDTQRNPAEARRRSVAEMRSLSHVTRGGTTMR